MSAPPPPSPAVAALLAARTATWDAAARAALGTVVAALRPSARHLSDILDWIDDVVTRDGRAPADVLAAPDLVAALAGPGAPSDRLKRWKGRLRRLRFPRLATREEAFAAGVRALALGPTVVVAAPPDLEGDAISVHIRATSPADLARALDGLGQALARGAFADLFALVQDADAAPLRR